MAFIASPLAIVTVVFRPSFDHGNLSTIGTHASTRATNRTEQTVSYYQERTIMITEGKATGALRVVFTNGGHAHVSDVDGERFVWRARSLSVDVHLYADQGWMPRPHDTYASRVNAPSVRYANVHTMSDGAAPTAVRAAVSACHRAVMDVLDTDLDILRRAAHDDVTRSLARHESKAAELRASLAEQDSRIASLSRTLSELEAMRCGAVYLLATHDDGALIVCTEHDATGHVARARGDDGSRYAWADDDA